MLVLLSTLLGCSPAPAPAPSLDSCDVAVRTSRSWTGEQLGPTEGALVADGDTIPLDAWIPRGEHRLEVWGRTTTFDGEAGRLTALVDGAPVGEILVPEGDGTRAQLAVRIEDPGQHEIALRFANDAYAPPLDRNLLVSAVRLTRAAQAADPAQELRDGTRRANVLLVSVDTLRADRLSATGYAHATTPTLDGLASRGVRFDNAVSASHWTPPSHATLLTGLHVPEHGVRSTPATEVLVETRTTLAEVLRDAGYRTGGFVPGVQVTASAGFAQGFGTWVEQPLPADGQIEAFRGFLEADPAPFFAFLHLYDVHAPFDPAPPFDTMFLPPGGADAEAIARAKTPRWHAGPTPTPREIALRRAMYDGGVRETDEAIGRLLAVLDKAGRRDDTLLIVTSDHGEALGEHGVYGHGDLFGELVRVPLVISHPALEAQAAPTVEQVAAAVDVMPTILDLVGVEAPPTSGRSLVPAMAGSCDPGAVAWSVTDVRHVGRVSLLDRQGHFVDDGDRRYFFELPDDREERFDLGGDPVRTRSYAERTDAWRATQPPVQTDLPVIEWGDEQREILRELGYLD